MSPFFRPCQHQHLPRRLALVLSLGLALGIAAERPMAAADADKPLPPPTPSAASPSAAVKGANDLIAAKRLDEAIILLEPWVVLHPEDKLATETLLSVRVTLKEQEIRKLLGEQAMIKEMIVGDPDYEMAKARAKKAVQQRLDIVEYYVAQKQYGDAAALCNAILNEYPHDEAVLCLKFRILSTLVARERDELLKDQQYRHGEGINDVIRDGTFWRDPPKIPRTMWIFDEDIAAIDRARVEEKLKERVTLIYDGTNGTQSAQVREVLGPLFAYIGINYVILDDALGTEKLTIHLVDETVGTALETIAKLVKVRFNYNAGTVYVTNSDSEVMTTEIIRLESGLTDVENEASLANAGGAAGQTGNLTGGGGLNPSDPNYQQQMAQALQQQAQQQQQQQNGQNGQQQKSKSDLEKFLDKIPDIVVGWPTDGRIYLDRKSNTVYVRSTPSTIVELKRLLHALDYNNVQVLIEARFIEVSEDAARELGLDWSGGGNKGAISVGGADLVGPGGTANPAASGASIGTTQSALAGGTTPPNNGLFAQVLLNRGINIAAKVSALEQEGKADTLSEPKILALNNSLGILKVSQQVAYVSDYQARTTNQNSTVNTGTVVSSSTTALVPTYTTDETHILLKIRPSIARNSDIITLTIAPNVRELVDKLTSPFQYPSQPGQAPLNGTIEHPEFAERDLSATLHVQNGQTIALGGLTRERDVKKMAGVPFMSRIPLLGQLFRRDTKSSDRRNLVILVTAHIVDPNGSKLSDEIQRLRDTARVVLPPETLAEVEAQAAQQAPGANNPATVPAAPRQSMDSPWQKGR